jgi:TP901 family phage tail tape measure protein
MNTIRVVITAENASLRGVLRSSAAEVKTFGSQVAATAADSKVKTDFIGKAFLAMSAVIIAAFAASAAGAIQLEQSMRNVATISPYVQRNFDAVTDSVVKMSTELPQSANTLAKGLYDVASSGFAGKEGLTVLEVSAKAASAGLTDTATSARVITGVLNAYGLSAKDAASVSDVLFQTVNLGVITYEELANSLGQVTGIASAAKIPLADLGSAYATITLGGIDAAQSATALKRVIQSFIDPSKALNDVLLKLGYTSGEQAIKQDGLRTVLTKVRAEVGGTTSAFTNLFPEIRAATGALALTNNEGRTWARVANQMKGATDGAGATQKALAQQQQSLGYQIELTKNRIVAFGLEVGRALLPALKVVNEAVQTLLGGFSSLPGPVQTAIAVLAGVAAIVLAIGGAFLLLVPRIAATRDALISFGISAETLSTVTTNVVKFGSAISALAIGALSFAQIGKSAESTTAGVLGLTVAGAQLGFTFGGPMGAGIGAASGFLLGFAKDALTTTSAAEDLKQVIQQVINISNTAAGPQKTSKNFLETYYGDTAFQSQFTRSLHGTYDEVNDLGDLLQGVAKKTPASAQKIVDGFKNLRTETGKPLFTPGALDELQTYVDKGAEKFAKLAKAKRDEAQVNQLVAGGELNTKQAIAQVAAQADESSGAIANLTSRQKDLQKTLSAASDPGDAYSAAIEKRSAAQKAALDAQAQAEKDLTGSVSAETQAQIDALNNASGAWYDFSSAATGSLDTFLGELEKQNTATQNWITNLGTVAQRGGRAFAEQLANMGPEAAALVQQIATSSDPEFARAQADFATQGKLTGDAATKALDDALNKPGTPNLSAWEHGLQTGVDNLAAVAADKMPGVTQAFSDFSTGITTAFTQIKDGSASLPDAVNSVGSLADSFMQSAFAAGLSGDAAVKYALNLAGIPEDKSTDIHNTADLARVIVEQYLEKVFGIPPDVATAVANNAPDAQALVENYIAKLNEARQPVVTDVHANVNFDALYAYRDLLNSLPGVNGAEVGAAGFYGQQSANGGMFNAQGVRTFANGGEVHQAMIAPGRWPARVWAEPETGGESYIPHAMSKRGRATRILATTAGMFGYGLVRSRSFADGGMVFGRGGAGPGGVIVQTTVHFNAPVYGEDGIKEVATKVMDQRDRELEVNLRRNMSGVT